jgi:hypothetical protein
MGFEVFKVLKIHVQTVVFRIVASCSLVYVYQLFGRIYCSHLKCENGCSKLLCNGEYLPDYTVSSPRSPALAAVRMATLGCCKLLFKLPRPFKQVC